MCMLNLPAKETESYRIYSFLFKKKDLREFLEYISKMVSGSLKQQNGTLDLLKDTQFIKDDK